MREPSLERRAEELVKRLRRVNRGHEGWSTHVEAADLIEQLLSENRQGREDLKKSILDRRDAIYSGADGILEMKERLDRTNAEREAFIEALDAAWTDGLDAVDACRHWKCACALEGKSGAQRFLDALNQARRILAENDR